MIRILSNGYLFWEVQDCGAFFYYLVAQLEINDCTILRTLANFLINGAIVVISISKNEIR